MLEKEDRALVSVYSNRLRRLGVVESQITKLIRACSPVELKELIAFLKDTQCLHLNRAPTRTTLPHFSRLTGDDILNCLDEEKVQHALFEVSPRTSVDVDGLLDAGRASAAFSFSSTPVTKIPRVKAEDVIIDKRTEKKKSSL